MTAHNTLAAAYAAYNDAYAAYYDTDASPAAAADLNDARAAYDTAYAAAIAAVKLGPADVSALTPTPCEAEGCDRGTYCVRTSADSFDVVGDCPDCDGTGLVGVRDTYGAVG